MKKVKSSMENLVATIFCFLMNLIPGKKFWTALNVFLENTVSIICKNHKTVGQVKQINAARTNIKGNSGAMCLNVGRNYKNDYIKYLYESLSYLNINKISIKNRNQIMSMMNYEDTG